MKTNKYEINNVRDFLKIRNLKENETAIISINNDIDFNNVLFTPIKTNNNTIIIDGNNNKITNLNIENKDQENTGIFDKVKNIYVRDLEVDDFNINGGVCTGLLAGQVEHTALINNSKFKGAVLSEAYAGCLFGVTNKLYVLNSNIESYVKGIDVVGGIVGLTSDLKQKNNKVKSIIISKGKAKGNFAGYNSKAAEPYIDKVLKEAIKNLPIECSYEEMKLLEMTLKKNKR